jgi:hypothetical protein
MPHISLPEHLPGITGLLEYSQETAQPIRDLTQLLLRGDNTLSQGERELIATIVSYEMDVYFVPMHIPLLQICYLAKQKPVKS